MIRDGLALTSSAGADSTRKWNVTQTMPSSAAPPAIVLTIRSPRRAMCPRASVAAATSDQPIVLPTTLDQCSIAPPANPPIVGTIVNASSESDVTKNPAKIRKSNRRPSTEKRVALSTATSAAVRANTVSSVSLSLGW